MNLFSTSLIFLLLISCSSSHTGADNSSTKGGILEDPPLSPISEDNVIGTTSPGSTTDSGNSGEGETKAEMIAIWNTLTPKLKGVSTEDVCLNLPDYLELRRRQQIYQACVGYKGEIESWDHGIENSVGCDNNRYIKTVWAHEWAEELEEPVRIQCFQAKVKRTDNKFDTWDNIPIDISIDEIIEPCPDKPETKYMAHAFQIYQACWDIDFQNPTTQKTPFPDRSLVEKVDCHAEGMWEKNESLVGDYYFKALQDYHKVCPEELRAEHYKKLQAEGKRP